ncbi:MAG: hypothetical protein ABI639_12730 [Thermoanaerobaculia bacterium]
MVLDPPLDRPSGRLLDPPLEPPQSGISASPELKLTPGEITLGLFLVTVAVTVRFFALFQQIPMLDEWHALVRTAQYGFRAIASSLGVNDHSIPWTLYLELVDRTVGINEYWFFAPGAIASLAFALALPLALRREIGTGVAWFWAALLASSPTLIYYAREARPYGFTALLAPLAVVLWQRATTAAGTRRDGIGFVAATALVGWSLAPHLPFILAPVAVVVFWSSPGRAPFRSRLLLALTAGCTLLLLLGPPVFLDAKSVGFRVGMAVKQGWSLTGLVPLRLFSMQSIWPPIAMLGIAWLGTRQWARARRGEGPGPGMRPGTISLLGIAATAQIAAVALVRPYGTDSEIVFARYVLPVLPVLLLAVAQGLTWLAGRSVDRRFVTGTICSAVVAVQLVCSPLPTIFRIPNNFGDYSRGAQPPPRVFFLEPQLEGRISNQVLSAFYRQRRLEPHGSSAIIEAPYTGFVSLPYREFQVHHRQIVIGGLLPPDCEPSRYVGDGLLPTTVRNFRYLVDLTDREAVRRKKADWLVLHRSPRSNPRFPRVEDDVQGFDFEKCAAFLEALYGKPIVDKKTGLIFDLRSAAKG